MQWLILLIAAGAGALTPLQGTNAELNKHWQQPLWTTVWIYLSALLATLLVQAVVRQSLPTGTALSAAPWWAWTGGVLSIATTMAGLVYAQRLGSGIFTGISLTASVLVSILIDQMGWIGFKQHSATPLRLLGAALMIGGVWLVSRF